MLGAFKSLPGSFPAGFWDGGLECFASGLKSYQGVAGVCSDLSLGVVFSSNHRRVSGSRATFLLFARSSIGGGSSVRLTYRVLGFTPVVRSPPLPTEAFVAVAVQPAEAYGLGRGEIFVSALEPCVFPPEGMRIGGPLRFGGDVLDHCRSEDGRSCSSGSEGACARSVRAFVCICDGAPVAQ